ncbi:putative short-chain dehydrogenase [Escherichia coli]|uniref:Putative short-chain dehydrogenase n=1 Tax=Escherichia coli TaxID=562 RepID=A0A376D677_ECOLX|nr:putative short-chain dehydrogenase [Escherichia coli]
MLAQQGFDIGITWHSDEEGAKDTAREVVSHGVRAEIVQLDLGNLPEGAQALEKLIQRLGRIDVLVNNAGAMTKAPFLDMAFDECARFLPLMSMVHFYARKLLPARW